MIQNESELCRTDQHEHALRAIAAGIEAAHPSQVVADQMSLEGEALHVAAERYRLEAFERILVLGGGKPAGAVARALEDVLGDRIDRGVVVTNTPAETATVTICEGTHPLPSEANVEGTSRVLDCAATAGSDDLVLVIIGGGASALLCAPVEGVSLEAYRRLTTALLRSGASIDDLNAVRKHLSRIKGGRLAAELAPATVVGLVFSDVVGNPLDVIASGPTAPDGSTYEDALGVLDRYGIDAPSSVRQVLTEGVRGERAETPREGDEAFERVDNHVLADNRTALDAAARVCEEVGYTPAILSSRIEGEAREAGRTHTAIALECLETGDPFEPPVALLSGGETTVTVTGDGTGGPNQEFALAAAVELEGEIVLASVDTDGIDGPTDAAGAIVDETTVPDSPKAVAALDANDSCGYLSSRNALVRTGSTGTNVNDLRLVLVGTS